MVANALQDRRGCEIMWNMSAVMAIGSILSLFIGMYSAALILIVIAFIAGACWEKCSRPPVNNPAHFLKRFRDLSPPRPVLVCLGDSLTHGRMSDNWTVKIAPRVAEKMKFDKPAPNDFQDPVWVVNAGQNSITSWVILQERLQAALACYPDYITVMIGSNDVLSMYSPMLSADKVKTFNLPEIPNMPGLERNLTGILDFLTKASPKTEVGICTLPPMGENLSNTTNRLIKEANGIIHNIVDAMKNEKVTVLEVGERLQNEIISRNEGGKKSLEPSMMIPLNFIMVPLNALLGASYKSLTFLSGGSVLFDTLHLNEDGGDVVADIVTEWLFNKNVHKAIAVKQF